MTVRRTSTITAMIVAVVLGAGLLTSCGVATTTSLTANMSTAVSGQPVTFTATVTSSAQPTGVVTFVSGSTTIGTAALSGGVARLTTSTLSTGVNQVVASYAEQGTWASSSSTPVTVTVTALSSSSCGAKSAPPALYHHVVAVMMENRTWSDVGGVGFGDAAMPYLHSLAGSCTTFSNWTETNTAQNSLTQYIGLTSGVNNPNTVDDCNPSTTCRSTDDNIFRQVRVAGGTARNYVQGATTGCSAAGNAPKHVPDLYYYGTYTDGTGTHNDHDFCTTEVRPLTDLDVASLPTFAVISPTLCNDGHDCGNAQVDAFAKTWVSKILASPSYASGDTLVVVLWDEDHPVPNLLIAPTAHAGTLATTGAGHAAMLKTWEQMLGLPVLSTPQLTAAPSLRSSAHL